MISIRLTPKTRTFAMASALNVLKRGGVIAFATETVYGIGCDPRNAKAVNRMFAIKGRAENKPVQLIAGSFAQAVRVAKLNEFERKIASASWPGPLTLLVRLKTGIRYAPKVRPRGIIGIRVTPDAFLSDLVRRFGSPIAATSANRSGEEPARSGRGVTKAFSGKKGAPDLVIDGGTIPKRKPSTVARISNDGVIEVARQGEMKIRIC